MQQELADLRLLIIEWGPGTFTGCPLLYLQVLLLTHQYERAVDYLRNPSNDADKFTDGSETEAVHLAIALAHKHMLKLPAPSDANKNDFQLLQPSHSPDLDKTNVTIDLCSLLYQYALQYLSTKTPELALKYLALTPNSH